MTTATTPRLRTGLTTRLAGVLTALVMSTTINGGMLWVFNDATQGDQASAAVMAHSATTVAAKGT